VAWTTSAAALVAVYITLGILYESYILPLPILSTLPSAGVGALLMLMIPGLRRKARDAGAEAELSAEASIIS